ncbi:MAG: hypothetical protein HFJ45_10160 [Clostridia bacterium]|nr:hypothetical protein [Clostridia bacterium]
MAFSDIENNEKLKVFDIAIINNEAFDNDIIFKSSFEYLSDKENKDRLFNVKYTSEEEARKLLDEDKIIRIYFIRR